MHFPSRSIVPSIFSSYAFWWRHGMDTLSTLLALLRGRTGGILGQSASHSEFCCWFVDSLQQLLNKQTNLSALTFMWNYCNTSRKRNLHCNMYATRTIQSLRTHYEMCPPYGRVVFSNTFYDKSVYLRNINNKFYDISVYLRNMQRGSGHVGSPAKACQFTWMYLLTTTSMALYPGPWFNIKMSSYQYRKSHCGGKTVIRSSHLHHGISCTDKMTFYIDSAPWSYCSLALSRRHVLHYHNVSGPFY